MCDRMRKHRRNPAATDGTASTESTSDTNEGGADDGKLKVGFAQIGQESGWRDAETASIQFYAGQNLDTIDFKFADAQQKQENQIKAIKSFIDMGVDVIGLAPVVETGWDAVFTEAKDAGIPIILVDRMADVPEDLYATFIGSDFIEEGKNAADEMAKLIGNSGKIVQLEGTVGASAANDRKKGFEDQMAAEYPDIEIIASQTGDFTRAKGKEVMESFLKTYGSEIKGVYAHNDDMMLGAIGPSRKPASSPARTSRPFPATASRPSLKPWSLAKRTSPSNATRCSARSSSRRPRSLQTAKPLRNGSSPKRASSVRRPPQKTSRPVSINLISPSLSFFFIL